MAKEKAVTKETVKEAVKETVKESMKYRLELPDGTIIEGSTSIRRFKPNEKNNVINSGYQVKVADGNYSGNIMIIDYLKQERI
jgi:hypothetical protein